MTTKTNIEAVAMSDEQIIERCKAAGIRWIPPEPEYEEDGNEVGFPGLFDMVRMEEMRALLAEQSAAPMAEPKMPNGFQISCDPLSAVEACINDYEQEKETPVSNAILSGLYKARQVLTLPRASEQADEALTLPEPFKSPLTSFGMLVRALRIVAGTTLYDMAKALSRTPATLSSVECGRKPLTEEMVIDTYVFFTKLGVPDTLHALNAARAKDSK